MNPSQLKLGESYIYWQVQEFQYIARLTEICLDIERQPAGLPRTMQFENRTYFYRFQITKIVFTNHPYVEEILLTGLEVLEDVYDQKQLQQYFLNTIEDIYK